MLIKCKRKNKPVYNQYATILSNQSKQFHEVAQKALEYEKTAINLIDQQQKEESKKFEQQLQTQDQLAQQQDADIAHLTTEVLNLRQKDLDQVEELMKGVNEVAIEIAGETMKHDENIFQIGRYTKSANQNTEGAVNEIGITAERDSIKTKTLYFS